jgi:hypothetical protein
MALGVKSVRKSRMTGDCHVRFCERLGLQCPGLLDLTISHFDYLIIYPASSVIELI